MHRLLMGAVPDLAMYMLDRFTEKRRDERVLRAAMTPARRPEHGEPGPGQGGPGERMLREISAVVAIQYCPYAEAMLMDEYGVRRHQLDDCRRRAEHLLRRGHGRLLAASLAGNPAMSIDPLVCRWF